MTNEEKAKEIWNKNASINENDFLHYWRQYLKPAMDYKDNQFERITTRLKLELYPFSKEIGARTVYNIIRKIENLWEGGEEC